MPALTSRHHARLEIVQLGVEQLGEELRLHLRSGDAIKGECDRVLRAGGDLVLGEMNFDEPFCPFNPDRIAKLAGAAEFDAAGRAGRHPALQQAVGLDAARGIVAIVQARRRRRATRSKDRAYARRCP